jgi:hypothetical protein
MIMHQCDGGRSGAMPNAVSKEGSFAPEAGHEDLAGYGALDAVVDFLKRRLGRGGINDMRTVPDGRFIYNYLSSCHCHAH